MEIWKRSKRLQAIAALIPDNQRVADIGGDHAFLLISLAKEGRLAYGIVGEVNKGPYENAKRNVKKMGVQHLIDVRLGDGLSVLRQGEVDFLVMSGMGGSLITNILEQGKAKLSQIKGMVLQPNVNAKSVRSWLRNHDWQLIKETIVEEAGHRYEVLVSAPGTNPELYRDELVSEELLLEIGPLLWKEKHPLLAHRLVEELRRKKAMLKQLEKGSTETAQKKWNVEHKKIRELERVIKWLSKVTN